VSFFCDVGVRISQDNERLIDFVVKLACRPFYLSGGFIRRSLADWRTGGFTPPAQWNVIFPFIPSGLNFSKKTSVAYLTGV
jgi:hypothetical protein